MTPAPTRPVEPPERRRRRPVRTALAVLTAVTVALLLGVTAVLATAWMTGRALPALGAGGLVGVIAAAAGLRLALRRTERRGRTALAGAAALVTLSALAALVPLPDRHLPPDAVPGEARWTLPSGSQIRYVHVTAGSPARHTPVVFLHGGPGVADLAGDAAYFGQLAADGFDVYVYDQLGAGGSTRLSDPTGYRAGRDVTDLEQIRERIGANRMILIGHSYGGSLAGRYLAAHPEHVDRVVLISPAPLDPADPSPARLTARLDTAQRLRLYSALAAPRALLGYAMLQVSPEAAHAYLSDAEADARNDRVYHLSESALHCPGTDHPRTPLHATGFYRLQYPQSATAPSEPDPRPRLTGLPTPTLVLKGSCDYLSWHSALDYRDALPHATLVYLPGAGHNLYQDRPGDTIAAIRAFLTDRPLPLAAYPVSRVPRDYQGGP